MYKYGDKEMTPKEAFLTLEYRVSEGDFAKDIFTSMQEAKKALQKQIPKKALETREKYDFCGNVIYKDGYCPDCKNQIPSTYLFCYRCGKRIDWT